MKHCLIISAYKDVKAINMLIQYTPIEWGVFVHIDKKSSIDTNNINSRATTIKEYKVNWGSVEHLKAILLLLKLAVKKEYDYYHIISGQDFFAINPKSFDSIVGEKQNNYMDLFPLPMDGWWHGGYMIYEHKTLSSFGDIRSGWLGRLNRKLNFIQGVTGVHRRKPQFDMFGGSVYCSLYVDFVRYLLNDEFSKGFLSKLNNTTCSEEIYFQTIIMNSPYKNKVISNHLRYIDWTVPNGPKVLLLDDYSKIIESGSLFCRKVDSNCSHQLLEKLVSYINEV